MVRSAVVLNPAKVLDLEQRRTDIVRALDAAGWPEPTWWETTPEDSGYGQTRQAVEQGAEVVFVCGGDGTVRQCVGALAGTEVALAVLPSGTGNLLAANLGLPDDAAAGVSLATGLGRRRLDVGVVDGQCFAVMAGIGLDAQMLASTPERLKARVGWLAYVLAGARHLLDRSMRVQVSVDGGEPQVRRARTVVVGNVGRLQGGVRLLPDAQPDDGCLDVAVLAPRSLVNWAALAWAVVRRHRRVPWMETFRAERVAITSDRVQQRELDGDVIDPGRTLEVAVRPAALWLCVPQPEESEDLAEGAPGG